MCGLDKAMVILAAAGIQSPYNAPTRSRPPQAPLPSFPPQWEPKALTTRQHRDGRAELHCRQCRRSGNPEPLQCANTVMAAPTPLPSMQRQRESRAHTMRQHGHGRAEPHSRHSRRCGNPEPSQCANTVLAAPNPTPVILAGAGIQNPYNAPTRSRPRRTSLPSFSPQWESRALTMRQHRHGRAELHCRHSRRSGNPEPIQCANTVTAAPNLSPAILAAAGIQSPYHVPTRSLPHRTPLPSMPTQRGLLVTR